MASDTLVEMRVDRILVWLERQSNSAMEGAIAALDDMPLLVGPIGVLPFFSPEMTSRVPSRLKASVDVFLVDALRQHCSSARDNPVRRSPIPDDPFGYMKEKQLSEFVP